MQKKYYYYLDVIRLVSCVAILLYHLDILKGGYLAVATFFTLSGYLTCKSCFKDERFSFFKYYKNKILHIYLPLIIVVFLTILIIPLFKNIIWVNLKPETTSVIAGYNNFWQLDANLDYFKHHVSSPFMHFWFIGILLQFELVFPFVFIIFKKMGNKVKALPCILLFLLSVAGAVYFYIQSKSSSMMFVYYNTFTRVFSLLFGVFLAFYHQYYKNLTFKNKIASMIIFYVYIVLLILSFIFIKSSNEYFNIVMILVTIVSLRLVDYATSIEKKINIFDKLIKMLSSISYEVYLVQYPVIFIVGYTMFKTNYFFIILVTLVISTILHFILNNKVKYIKIPLLIILLIFTSIGGYKYIEAKDYTEDMKKLEENLNKNEELMQQKMEEFLSREQKENEEWNVTLEDIKKGEEEIKAYVKNLSVIGVGDSVMLGAVSGLYEMFPNSYFDAKTSRTDYEAAGVLRNLASNNMLGNPIVLSLGTNGQCGARCRDEVLAICGDREIFMLTVTNDYEVYVNEDLINYANSHDNVHIIDWNNISKGHTDYFIADGIHLTPVGVSAYANAIYDALLDFYMTDYNKKVEELLKQHEEEEKNKMTFYGNELLLNQDIFDYYSDAKFEVNKDYTYDSLVKLLNQEIENNSLTHKLIFAFDNTFDITEEQYKKIIELCYDHEIYIVSFKEYNLDANVIYFDTSKYMMIDNIHLTDEGSKKLFDEIIKKIEKSQ